MDHETPEGGDTRKVGTKSRNLKKEQSDKKSCDKKVKKKKNKDGKTWNIHKSQKRNKSPKESESPKESKIGTQDKLSEDNIPKILFSDKKHIKVELTVLQKAIQCNEIFLRDLAYCASMDSLMKNMFIPGYVRNKDGKSFDRVLSILRQVCREWTYVGRNERDNCFKRLVDRVCDLFPEPGSRNNAKVLIPGCGLGRLVYDFMWKGFNAVGCEFSVYMLFASNLLMNRCTHNGQYNVAPWLTQRSHLSSSSLRFLEIPTPELNDPTVKVEGGNCSIEAGDFLDIYNNDLDTYDVIVASYFLDTARNILLYLLTVYKLLKPGGHFLNFGPLHYHFENQNVHGIELSYEEIMEAVLNIGFIVIEEKVNIKDTYCHNPYSLSKHKFKCNFLVLQKPQQKNVIKTPGDDKKSQAPDKKNYQAPCPSQL